MNLAELLKPQGLDHYWGLTAGGRVQTSLTPNEAAAVLQAYDYGLAGMTQESRALLDSVIGKLKDQLWP